MNETQQRTAKLGIVLPLANEEALVESLLRQILSQLGQHDLVVCVLDNKSRDKTLEIVKQVADRSDPRIVPLWAPENRCVVDAYFRGYHEALRLGCDWILEMDGGFSHRPEEIPRFIAAMTDGADFAAGSRFVSGGTHAGSWRRYWVSRGGTMLTNLLLGTKMRDMTSGFECFSRAALAHVLERGVRSRAHFFQTEIRVMLSSWNWVEVPINYTNPSESVGGAQIKDALRCLWALYRDQRRGKHTGANQNPRVPS